jgi:hypothetical protein
MAHLKQIVVRCGIGAGTENKEQTMTDNPFKALLMSRKFWLAMLDIVVSLTTYFVTKYSNPQAAEDVLKVIAALQPLFVTIIGAIAYEDGKVKGATTHNHYHYAGDGDGGYVDEDNLPLGGVEIPSPDPQPQG